MTHSVFVRGEGGGGVESREGSESSRDGGDICPKQATNLPKIYGVFKF